jgi:hypothetical protein
MRQARFTETQIAKILKEVEGGRTTLRKFKTYKIIVCTTELIMKK